MKKAKRLSFKDISLGTSMQRYFTMLIIVSAIVFFNATEVKVVVESGGYGVPVSFINITAKYPTYGYGSCVEYRFDIESGSDKFLRSQFIGFVPQNVSANGRSEAYVQLDKDCGYRFRYQAFLYEYLNHSNLLL
ncbi:MAG: hypothetical protein DWQ02_22910 [Bacteroidetes bacterium]|nr:MAG: hypothetical protein DWQ02_22910 [Bacteroidota bacterium]